MLKIVCMFNFRADVDPDEAMRHWTQRHPDVVRACVPGVERYVQNVPVPVRGRSWPYQAISELWFADMESLKAAYSSPELVAERIRDEAHFMTEEYEWLIVEEVECW